MAFRVQDPATNLFWKLDGKNIILAEEGSDFTEDDTGIVGVATAGVRVYSLPRKSAWKMTSDGFITCDDYHYIIADNRQMRPLRSLQKQVWAKVVEGVEPTPVAPEPVPAPVVEPVEDDVPDLVSESEEVEDVPVARSAALIEEALNAQAAATDSDKDTD